MWLRSSVALTVAQAGSCSSISIPSQEFPHAIGVGKEGRKEGRRKQKDRHNHTIVHGMDGQWGPAEERRKFYSMFCNNLYGKRT